MNPVIKRYLVSSLSTFLSAFFTVLGAQLTLVGHVEFTFPFWTGVVLVAIRAATKAVVEAVPSFGSADKKA